MTALPRALPRPEAGTLLDLREWQTLTSRAAGVTFEPTPAEEALAASLESAGTIGVSFLRSETRVSAWSHVGSLRLGGVTIRVRPKISGAPLLRLVRFAYGLGDLKLLEALEHTTAEDGLLELLVAQVAAELDLLIRGGLRRGYRRTEAELAAPRGKLDLRRIAARGPSTTSVPCIHHPRTFDTALHRVLAGGVELAAGQATDSGLRLKLLRIRDQLDGVKACRVDARIFEETSLSLDRTTVAYGAILSILTLLARGLGVAQAGQAATFTGRGFLFDMNRFFQSLLSRLLRENGAGLVIRDEHRLGALLRWAPGTVDAGRLPMVPRPDFAVIRDGRVVGLFDAKYRDLWEGGVPRDMLYQLALYAQSREGSGVATMLYPSAGPRPDRIIEVLDPTGSSARARVVVRAVDLVRLAELVAPGRTFSDRAPFATALLA